MLSRPACLILGAGLGASIQPAFALILWAMWRHDTRKRG